VTASVPEVVIGDPATVSHEGTVIPTDVTVPVPEVEISALQESTCQFVPSEVISQPRF